MPKGSLDIRIDPAQFRLIESELSAFPSKIQTAATAAMNKTARTGIVRIKRIFRDSFTVKDKALNGKVTLQRQATDKSAAVIRINDRSIPAIAFETRVLKGRGVSVRIRRGGAAVILPHAFKASGPTVGLQVFERVGRSRLPLFRWGSGSFRNRMGIGTSAVDMYEQVPDTADRVNEEIGDVLQKNVLSQIDRFLNAKNG